MSPKQIRDLLIQENATKPAEVEMYVQQFATYYEATTNIRQNGVVVAHPRTGQPMENPYVKIRLQSEAAMKKSRLKTGSLWIKAGILWDEAEGKFNEE